MTDRTSHRIWVGAAVALTAAKIWLTRGQGVYAIGNAALDDQLFLDLARHLVRGEWLGPYTVLTLAKGPAYPLFIATSFILGLPLFLSQHLLYAAACGLFTRALKPAIKSAGLRFGVFALLLCNPMTFDAPAMGRVLRQHIYGPFALMIFAGLVALCLRRAEPRRRQWPWAVLGGLAAGGFYLTREETVWLAPSLALLAGAAVVMAWRTGRGELRRVLTLLALAGGVAAVPVLTVCALNRAYYGWFGTCEFRASPFADAYGAMVRVRVGPELPYVPVTREARVAMAKASPRFAEVQRQFDQGLARNWAGVGEFMTHQPPEAGQIGGGWYMWALREAVSNAGHCDNARVALDFYGAMARELNSACDRGELPAGPPRSGFMPRWQQGDTHRFLQATADFASFVVRFRHFGAKPPPSTGSPEELELFRDLTRERLSPPEGQLDVVGAKRYLLNLWKVDVLQHVGYTLRFILLGLFIAAQAVAILRAAFLLWRRSWSYPLTVAAAAWGACLASILMHAVIQATSFPVLTISSFAPIYPLLLVFIAAVFWDAGAACVARRRAPRAPRPAVVPLAATIPPPPTPVVGAARVLPWVLGLGALAPFLIWYVEFRKLFWFGDGLFLLDQLAEMGMREWSTRVFAENFVPLFKLLWGGAAVGFHGSYLAMLWLLWLTHALNTAMFARLLGRVGLGGFAVAAAALVFALTPINLETLGWSVQWSAVLATSFLLLALVWAEARRDDPRPFCWSLTIPLMLFTAASACCFSRGVLTGGVLAATLLLPALFARDWRFASRRLLAAALILLPAIVVALLIELNSSGNHHHLAGHGAAILQFAATYFLLNPFFSWVTAGPTAPAALVVLAIVKVAVLAGGFRLARGRARHLLLLLLIYDLGNAVLIGVGRYHTGFLAALSSRYQYSSLLATLPFAAVLIEAGWQRMTAPVLRRRVAAAGLVALVVWCLAGWPAELRDFTDWRGTRLRALLAEPATADPAARVPALDFMHVERAKALQRAYHLH